MKSHSKAGGSRSRACTVQSRRLCNSDHVAGGKCVQQGPMLVQRLLGDAPVKMRRKMRTILYDKDSRDWSVLIAVPTSKLTGKKVGGQRELMSSPSSSVVETRQSNWARPAATRRISAEYPTTSAVSSRKLPVHRNPSSRTLAYKQQATYRSPPPVLAPQRVQYLGPAEVSAMHAEETCSGFERRL